MGKHLRHEGQGPCGAGLKKDCINEHKFDVDPRSDEQ